LNVGEESRCRTISSKLRENIYEENSSGPLYIQIALVLEVVNVLNLLPEIS
jgi:predicted nucleic-acid-binding protein